jgi:hypothetical protein
VEEQLPALEVPAREHQRRAEVRPVRVQLPRVVSVDVDAAEAKRRVVPPHQRGKELGQLGKDTSSDRDARAGAVVGGHAERVRVHDGPLGMNRPSLPPARLHVDPVAATTAVGHRGKCRVDVLARDEPRTKTGAHRGDVDSARLGLGGGDVLVSAVLAGRAR